MVDAGTSDGSVINSNLICRLCLSESEKLLSLFRLDEIETSAVPLSMKVSLCTTIRMSKHDVLPRKICENCFNYINDWYKFRKKCIQNDSYLKKMLLLSTEEKPTAGTAITRNGEEMKYCNLDVDANENGDKLNIILESESAHCQTDNLICDELSQTEDKIILSRIDSVCDKTDFKPIDQNDIPMKLLVRQRTKKFQCPSCPDSFYYLKDLKLHKSVIHKTLKMNKAHSVNETPVIKDEDLKLNDIRARMQYEMKCCDKIFHSKVKFRKHCNRKHPGEKPFMCETCGKKDFISEETLKRHKILHTGKYRCEICLKTFTCNAILIIHKRDKHENDKPFICDVCGKRFVTELLMNYHKRFHTGEKKYICEECGLAVVTSSSLAKHKRIHSNEKPHVCQICGKGFIIKGRLVEHLRIHTGERPYSCHICHKGFTMRDKLKRHIRIHSGEKLFSCEYCGNNYSTSYGLTVHLKTHVVRNY